MRGRLVAALALLPTMCRAAGPDELSGRFKDYNVILISITNVGAKHMSLYGYERPTTPELDAWAKDAFVFDHAYTHASWTLPVAVSLFTSLYPYTHRIYQRDVHNELDAHIKTLTEILRDHGYSTAAFTGGLDYFAGFSHMRGFHDRSRNPNFVGFAVTADEASRWLAAHRGKKFFLLVHSYDAHCPYLPAPPFKGRFTGSLESKITIDPTLCVRGMRSSKDYTAEYFGGCPQFPRPAKCSDKTGQKVRLTQDDIDYLRGSYDEKIEQEDSLLGSFLASLPADVRDKTIVLVESEHGEMFAKHGRFGRAGTRRGTLYDDVVHVPLIVKLPGVAGRRVKPLAQLVDVMPTLLDLLGLPAGEPLQGSSLVPTLLRDSPVHDYVYAGAPYNLQGAWDNEFSLWSRDEAVRDERWKLIHEVSVNMDKAKAQGREPKPDETFELYDTSSDPDEGRNVAAEHPAELARLTGRLEAWAKAATSVAKTPATRKAPEELLRKAREYGYWQ